MPRIALVLLATLAIAVPAAATRKRSTHKSTTIAKGHTSRSAARPHTSAGSRTARRTKGSTRKSSRASSSRAVLPSGPTPDRYREIQQALAAKGYYNGEANGQWTPESAEALKRFQAEQNLPSDGKLNSLTLIALGLGPKRATPQPNPTGAHP